MAVQRACSTSLVAVQLACQGADLPMRYGAGGRDIYRLYPKNRLHLPRGRDSLARWSLPGIRCSRSGNRGWRWRELVVLKRLEDAIADRDSIYAIIRGAAINNDGAVKVGYTAPSVGGQAEVIAMAQAMARVAPETITYVEAHGTGTALGDPIEIAALTEAFRAYTQKKGFCAIGSLKTNIGHVNAAAGIAGLIKTVLMMQHQCLPPSLHYTESNPAIDFANSPFYVNHTLSDWPTGNTPRRAGVSSFGIGGTNAHVILEEAAGLPLPQAERLADASQTPDRQWQFLLLSARSQTALDTASANLVAYLQGLPNHNNRLADVAYTLQTGRRTFRHQRMAVCQGVDDAIAALESSDPQRVFSAVSTPRDGKSAEVVFLFPGQGAQYANMASDLYRSEPTFRQWIDRCTDGLRPRLGLDLRRVIYPDDVPFSGDAPLPLQQTAMAQPALFMIEYALAQLWISWGVKPQAMIGHSIGEYTAAWLVFFPRRRVALGDCAGPVDAATAWRCDARRAIVRAGDAPPFDRLSLSGCGERPVALCGIRSYRGRGGTGGSARCARRALSPFTHLACLSFRHGRPHSRRLSSTC